jgi:hypothetical protein
MPLDPANMNSAALTERSSRAISMLGVALLISSMNLSAQTAIPVPKQLATAKTVFVGYAGSRWYTQAEGILVYQSVRKVLASSGYTVVQSPADSELSLEASVTGDEISDIRLQLVVYDTKSHTLLWAFDEPLNGRVDTAQKNLDKSVALFAADLHALSSGPIAAQTAPDTKTRMSQEPK